MNIYKKMEIKKQNQIMIGWVFFCFIIFVGIALFSGANLIYGITFSISVFLSILLPGIFFAQMLAPKEQGLVPILALVYGVGFFAVVTCIALRFHQPWLLRIVPLIPSSLFLLQAYKHRTRIKQKFQMRQKFLQNWFVFGAFLTVLFALLNSAENAHPTAAGMIDLSRDLLWNIGNGQAFTQNFPPLDLRFAEVRFSYHYLTELLAGGLSIVSGASSYDIFVFFAGPFYIFAELFALYSLGRCFYEDDRIKSLLFPVLLFFFQCASTIFAFQGNSIFGNTLLIHLITNINAQATAVLFLSAFTILFSSIAKQRFFVSWRYWLAYFGTFFLLLFAKGPQAALVFCSFVITMVLILIFQKPNYIAAIFCLIGTTGLFFFIYRILFSSGTNHSVYFSTNTVQASPIYPLLSPFFSFAPLLGLIVIGVLNSFCMMPFQSMLWLRGLPHTIRYFYQMKADHLLANGVVVGGFLAYHLFWHPNSSQVYFALVAMIYMTLLCVEKIADLKQKTFFAKITMLCAFIGATSTLVMIGANAVQGGTQFLRTAHILPAAASAGATSAQEEEAMQWLRKQTNLDFVFATNRTSSEPDRWWDGISNVYTALSGRQAYMDGWAYSVSNMGVSEQVVNHRKQVQEQLFSPNTTKEQLEQLAKQEKIDALVFAKDYPGQVNPQLIPAYQNEKVAIYWLSERNL